MTHDYGAMARRLCSRRSSVGRQGHRECTPAPPQGVSEFLRGGPSIPKEDLHLIADNYATQNTRPSTVAAKHHPRFPLHFTPTSSSWLNMVERWFGENHAQTDPTRGVYQRLRPVWRDPRVPRCYTTTTPSHSSGPHRQRASSPRSLSVVPFRGRYTRECSCTPPDCIGHTCRSSCPG